MTHASHGGVCFLTNGNMDMRRDLPRFLIESQSTCPNSLYVFQVDFRPDGSILVFNLFTCSHEFHLAHTSDEKRNVPLFDAVHCTKLPEFRKKVFSMSKSDGKSSSQC